jgi:uncharacterized protein YmfQ (DUF2313 family)
MGGSYGGNDWEFVWYVHSPLNSVDYRYYGSSVYGEPYATWQNAVLECVMRQHDQAHTQVLFVYS